MAVTVREKLESPGLDLKTFVEMLDPNVVWRGIEVRGEKTPICRNRNEVRDIFEHHISEGRRGRFEVIAEAGDRLVVDPHPVPPVPGFEQIHHVYTLRGETIVHMQDYPDRKSSLEAVGLGRSS
jgi:ketosteroid isomerase-like protein